MKAFMHWRCKKCHRGKLPPSAKECFSCGTARGEGGASIPTKSVEASPKGLEAGGEFGNKRAREERIEGGSNMKKACGSLGAIMQKCSKDGQPFRDTYKSVTLPKPWKAAHKGSVIFRNYLPERIVAEVNQATESSSATGNAPAVAAFDFDNTLVSNNFADRNSSVESNLMFPDLKAVLSGIHSKGYRIVIFSNNSLARLKNPDPIRNEVLRKTRRVDRFCELMNVPVEVYLATHKDQFRKASSNEIASNDPKLAKITASSSALWDFMASDPTQGRRGAPNKEKSFYVGDAAAKDHDKGGDADRNFAEAAGVSFFTEAEFFLHNGQGRRLAGLEDDASRQSPQEEAEEAKVARLRLRTSLSATSAHNVAISPLLVVMCGLPGSGKSTAARAVVQALPDGAAVRVSQDVLKTAKKVETAIQEGLSASRIVIVDKTNATADKRGELLRLAGKMGASTLVFSIFPGEYECKARCASRNDHDDPAFPSDPRKIDIIIGRIRNSAALDGGGTQLEPKSSEGMDYLASANGPMSKVAVFSLLANHIAAHFDRQAMRTSATTLSSSTSASATVTPTESSSQAVRMKQLALPLYQYPSAPIAKPLSGDWRSALRFYCDSSPPSAFQPWIYMRSPDFCVIYDAYPKAKVHLLAMFLDPIMAQVNELQDLTPEHLPLLKNMHNLVFQNLIPHLRRGTQGAKLQVRAGFHAIPSLNRLHLHIISQDFDSPRLKTKQHWVSFTHHSYFIDLDRVLQVLSDNASWTPAKMIAFKDKAKKIDQKLVCHRCGQNLNSMPNLKVHIATCTSKSTAS